MAVFTPTTSYCKKQGIYALKTTLGKRFFIGKKKEPAYVAKKHRC